MPSSRLEQLRAIGGDAFVREIIEELMTVGPGHIREMEASLEVGDVESFHRAVHSLGTLVLTVDLDDIGQACRALEVRCIHAIPEDARQHVAHIRRAFELLQNLRVA